MHERSSSLVMAKQTFPMQLARLNMFLLLLSLLVLFAVIILLVNEILSIQRKRERM